MTSDARTLRVIHVSPTGFGPEGLLGGGERYALELARAVSRRTDTELVTFGPHQRSYRDDDLRVRVLRPWKHLRGHPAQALAPSLIGALEGADIVHIHQMRSLPGRMAAVAARLRRRRAMVTDHGLGRSKWPSLVPHLFDRFLLVSQYSAATLRSPPSRTRVIYGGADTDRFRPAPGSDRSYLLFVGRITPHKGLDVLIRALPEGARLLVSGSTGHDPRPPESNYRRDLERLAAGKDVRFLGAVDDVDLPDLYRGAIALVLPSVERTRYGREVAIPELLGLVQLEAMACATPVVCSRVGGLPEVVDHGRTGFVVDGGDVAALNDRLQKLWRDPRPARSMGEAARDTVVANYTWDHCAARCLDVYRCVVRSDSE